MGKSREYLYLQLIPKVDHRWKELDSFHLRSRLMYEVPVIKMLLKQQNERKDETVEAKV